MEVGFDEIIKEKKEIFGSIDESRSKALEEVQNKVSSEASIDTFSSNISARWNLRNAPGSRPYNEEVSEFSGDIIFFDRNFVAAGDAVYRSNVMPRWVDSWGVEYDDATQTLKLLSQTVEFVVPDALRNPKISFRLDVARSGFQLVVRQNIQISTGRNWYIQKGSYMSLYLR